MPKRPWLAGVAVLVMAGLFVSLMAGQPSGLPQPFLPVTATPLLLEPSPAANRHKAAAAVDAAVPGITLAQALQSTSLRGTSVDRPQLETVDGKLVLNGTILFYFDYFLSLQGEMPLEQITALLREDLEATYPAAIAMQLLELFARYLDYLQEMDVHIGSVTREQVLDGNLSASDMQVEVRLHHFSAEEITALFGDQERMLARPSQASLRQQHYEQYRQVVMANPAEQERIATELYGPQAAANLRNLEYARQQWAGRVAHYENEKARIVTAYPGDLAGQEQAIGLLQQRLFNEAETRRLKALERLHPGVRQY